MGDVDGATAGDSARNPRSDVQERVPDIGRVGNGPGTPTSSINLPALLLIALTTGFVALLIELTGEFGMLWPLYGVPIIVAALAYHVPGAVVMTAIAGALIGFHAFEAGLALTADVVGEAAIGLGVFLVSGLAVGTLTRRQRSHADELERISVYDPLTGLYSAQYFASRLDEEMRRAARYEGSVALVLLDLDDLKAFNETFGTRRGDLLLAHLAEVLKIAVRDTDVIAHLRGGRFALISPHCEKEDAPRVAERLRTIVETTEFEGDELEPITRHTVSAGISTCPDPVCDAEELFALAETALGKAKTAGKNRTEVGAPARRATGGEP